MANSSILNSILNKIQWILLIFVVILSICDCRPRKDEPDSSSFDGDIDFLHHTFDSNELLLDSLSSSSSSDSKNMNTKLEDLSHLFKLIDTISPPNTGMDKIDTNQNHPNSNINNNNYNHHQNQRHHQNSINENLKKIIFDSIHDIRNHGLDDGYFKD